MTLSRLDLVNLRRAVAARRVDDADGIYPIAGHIAPAHGRPLGGPERLGDVLPVALPDYTHVSSAMERDAVDAAFGGVFGPGAGFHASPVRQVNDLRRSKAC